MWFRWKLTEKKRWNIWIWEAEEGMKCWEVLSDRDGWMVTVRWGSESARSSFSHTHQPTIPYVRDNNYILQLWRRFTENNACNIVAVLLFTCLLAYLFVCLFTCCRCCLEIPHWNGWMVCSIGDDNYKLINEMSILRVLPNAINTSKILEFFFLLLIYVNRFNNNLFFFFQLHFHTFFFHIFMVAKQTQAWEVHPMSVSIFDFFLHK